MPCNAMRGIGSLASAAIILALCSSCAAASSSFNPGVGVNSVEIGGGGSSQYWPYQIYKSAPFNPPVWGRSMVRCEVKDAMLTLAQYAI